MYWYTQRKKYTSAGERSPCIKIKKTSHTKPYFCKLKIKNICNLYKCKLLIFDIFEKVHSYFLISLKRSNHTKI